MSCQNCGCDPEAKRVCSQHRLLVALTAQIADWIALSEEATGESRATLHYCIRCARDIIAQHKP